jgi:4-hydroxybenzoate polyprenyltransferase
MLSVYASNDLLDLRTDRKAVHLPQSPKIAEVYDVDVMSVRHPVALGVLSTRLAVAWVVGLGLVALVFAYLLRSGCAAMFVGCVCLEVIYCALKHQTWLKTIPGGAMVGLGGLAGWYAVKGLDLYALSLFLLLTFWEIFGRNLTNDLADLSHDAPLGIKTLATVHGPKWSARVSFAGTVAILPVAALQQGSFVLRLLLVVVAAWTMTLPAFELFRAPGERAAQRVFNRASFFPPLAFLATVVFFAIRGVL